MINASVAVQILPKVENDAEVVRIVDEVIAYIQSFNVKYFVGPFETVIEGDYEELMQIVKGCHEIAVRAGAESLMSYIKLCYKPAGGILTIEEKTDKYHR